MGRIGSDILHLRQKSYNGLNCSSFLLGKKEQAALVDQSVPMTIGKVIGSIPVISTENERATSIMPVALFVFFIFVKRYDNTSITSEAAP